MSERDGPAHAFLRWAGAKRSFVEQLAAYIPANLDTYYEPFLGAGSLLFHVAPQRAVAGDVIGPLIDTFIAVRDEPEQVYREITKWQVDKHAYYMVRGLEPLTTAQQAAKFIYLNKTCWNGLYRVNRQGVFNVPFGRPKSSNIATIDNLLACSKVLKGVVDLSIGDFEDTLKGAKKGDFVFLDPPYITTHATNGFVEYNEKLFTWADQSRLASLVKELDDRNVRFLMTNADHQSVRELYADFNIGQFERMSTIASSRAHRRKISELLITNQESQ